MKKLFLELLEAIILGIISGCIKASIGAFLVLGIIPVINKNSNAYINEDITYFDAFVMMFIVSIFADLFLKPEKPNKE